MYSPPRISTTALFFLALSACTGWTRLTDVPPRQPPEFRQLEVWSHSVSYVLYAVRLDSDTLSGVPTGKDRNCVECRLLLPMAEVDSIRGGGTIRAVALGAGVVAGIVVGFMSLLFLLYHSGGT